LSLERDARDGTVWAIWTPYGLRDELAAGQLLFGLNVGSSVPEYMQPEKIVGFRRVSIEEWEGKTPLQLFHERPLGFVFSPASREGRLEIKRFKDFRGLKLVTATRFVPKMLSSCPNGERVHASRSARADWSRDSKSPSKGGCGRILDEAPSEERQVVNGGVERRIGIF
jgi:hypothetical protein